MTNLIVEFRLLHPDARRPEYKTDGASGMDLCAIVRDMPASDGVSTLNMDTVGVRIAWLEAGKIAVFSTGVAVALPQGYEAQIRPRSSLSARGILCQLGTIDNDYRGELKVVLVNLSGEPFEVRRGDRIAQLVVAPVARAAMQRVEAFSTETRRDNGGFGSTDVVDSMGRVIGQTGPPLGRLYVDSDA